MTTTPCGICGVAAKHAFSANVLLKHHAEFYRCVNCGFLQTPSPGWLAEAYSDAIVAADTGLVDRNIKLSRVCSALFFFLFPRRGKFLDIAGGYGLFVRIMRDIGFDFFWSDKYCANQLARGFEDAGGSGYTAITAVEVIEHVPDPLEFIRSALATSGSDSIVFTTLLYSGSVAPPPTWWYYTFDTGQHVSFFQRRTLEFMADALGLHLHTNGSVHLLTTRKISRVAYFMTTTPRLAMILSLLPRLFMRSKMVLDHQSLTKAARGD